uniref:IPT1 n=1 Tax=Arundo donax TaxID=35708 RepID=A0A0A9B8X6_ARUDO
MLLKVLGSLQENYGLNVSARHATTGYFEGLMSGSNTGKGEATGKGYSG